jgi:hypothetical protein
MGLNPNFPGDPHAILDPDIRWYPGEEKYSEDGYATLLPPLVYEIRKKVGTWRTSGYAGASNTTKALLNHWFNTEHLLPQENGNLQSFQYYFCQREAVESDILLYEVEEARDPYALIKYDASGRISKGMFHEDWTRYVMKLATGTGKTKVMSLLIAWAYFNKRYEPGSDLSTNFLVIAPNIIVLDRLREDIVSVMVLREEWDVQNVVALVSLRPYKAKSQILPEQTLGRGLRRMFRGQPVVEKVSVVGTSAFMDFVESIKNEGVELEYAPMGGKSQPKSPLVAEVDNDNESKDINNLDIELPILAPRIYREYKDLGELDVGSLRRPKFAVEVFSEQEKREIVFKDIDRDDISHTTVMDSAFTPSHHSAVGFFARAIMRDLRLVGGFDILFGKLKEFMEKYLFDRSVDLDDLNVLRNISEAPITKAILETFKSAINALTVKDKGTTEIRDSIKLSKTRPFVVNDQAYLVPKKSIFNKVVGDSGFELEFAGFLDGCADIISFAKNYQSTSFRIEYRTVDGGIANYYPDFVVKETESEMWLIETKGREDLQDPLKWERLVQWCQDAAAKVVNRNFRPLFIRQEQWEKYRPKNFKGLCAGFSTKPSDAVG